MANIRECLACEQSFNPADNEILPMIQQVDEKFKDQYCSKSCQDSYEQYLNDMTKIAEAQGLGIPNSGALTRPIQNNSSIDAMIAQFRKKEQK